MTKNIKYFLGTFFLTSFLFWGINSLQYGMEKYFYAQIVQPFENLAVVDISEITRKPKPSIEAESVACFKINKAGKQRFLFRKNSAKSLAVASLTKLMTGLLVIENTSYNDYDLNRKIIVSKTAADQYNVPVYGNLKQGQQISVEELLELMLHYSSNDAAYALAEIIGFDNFIERMNEKVKVLELENTYFINPTGLDPDNSDLIPNYSTASDLIKLSKYILENHPFLFELSLRNESYLIENGVLDLNVLASQTIIGGKTGYTERAGAGMLVVFSDENDNYFINVILGSESPQKRVEEMQKLIDWIAF